MQRPDISKEQRQQAADRLTKHLLQKGGRPAPYKERFIEGLANPVPGCMPNAVAPIPHRGPLGLLQRLVFAVENRIRESGNQERQDVPNGTNQTVR